ncbi:MAG: hypothetical protein SNJ83_09230 [Aggregatilineales bacterium]
MRFAVELTTPACPLKDQMAAANSAADGTMSSAV